MPKNLPVWPKRFLLMLLVLGGLLYGQDTSMQDPAQQAAAQEQQQRLPEIPAIAPLSRWYRSNASGMMLESIPSRAAALRNEYALAVSPVRPDEIPVMLVPYFASSYSVELRVLFENRKVRRQQWIFRDGRGTTRLNASGTDGLFHGIGLETGKGFIEIYNDSHTLVQERLFTEGSESLTLFTYSRGLLIKAETWLIKNSQGEEPKPSEAAEKSSSPDITDYYRYTRSASLRAIERVFHSGSEGQRRIPFPSIGPIFSKEPAFENPGVAHSSEFLEDVIIPPEGRVIYSTDTRGRVLSEKRLDENGELLGELTNSWTGDRLDSVSWKSGNDEWLIEYEYDDKGDRTMERNFNRGVLERTVRSEGSKEVEELYMNGRVILRAVWEDGRKISEERVRGSR